MKSSRWSPWLLWLLVRLAAAAAAGAVRWALFLARRSRIREEIRMVIVERCAGSGARLILALAVACSVLCPGCSGTPDAAESPAAARPPRFSAERLNFDKAADTVVEFFSPVYGTSNPPMDFLSETVLNFEPDCGQHMLETLGDILTP